MSLPAIGDHIRPLTHVRPVSNTHYAIPRGTRYWRTVYAHATDVHSFQFPVRGGKDLLDPRFSYFGPRFDPLQQTLEHMHIGLDIFGSTRKQVHPICDGVLEYSGYGAHTGSYIFLRHPAVTTADGFTLYSLYLHLGKRHISFSAYQKMLREISFHTYPEIPVAHADPIGRIGNSGLPTATPSHVHVQCEFRRGNVSVAVDPLQLLGMRKRNNTTARLRTHAACVAYINTHKDALTNWLPLWQAYLQAHETATY